jgi:hypothetical protein
VLQRSLLVVVSFLQFAFAMPAKAQSIVDSTSLSTTYLFAGFGGFIPLRESYRLNYSTSLGGIPLEMMGGVLMPISQTLLVPLTVRYIRREANFISSASIKVLSFEPGVRFFLERHRENDIRVFGGIEGLLAQATVAGEYESTVDGSSPIPATTSKTHLNYGVGFDIGATYGITVTSAVDVVVHVSSYFGSSAASGGVGNIGGVSIGAAYRIGF